MPELPEVETVVRKVRPGLIGRRIVRFESLWPRQCTPSAKQIHAAICRKKIESVARRAKFIVINFSDGGHLLIHLRMSGRLEWADDLPQRPSHVRATFKLDNGREILFDDARKFGRIIYAANIAAATADLGIEPLESQFTPEWLLAGLRRRSRALKPLLLDQSFIAGLGNIYVDESLFRSGLHPAAKSDRLRADAVHRLHAAIRDVLAHAIERNGTSFDWIYPGGQMQDDLAVYGRTGRPCPRCRTPITTFRIAQRGTHICPKCQPKPRLPRTRTPASI